MTNLQCFSKSLILLFFISFVNCAAGQELDDVKALITESNAKYSQALTTGDATLFAERYAEDCWIMVPNADAFCGPDATRDYFSHIYFDQRIRRAKFVTIDVYGVSTDIVAEVGFRHLYNENGVQLDDGKYIVLWKKTSKGWKMFRDAYSSSKH